MLNDKGGPKLKRKASIEAAPKPWAKRARGCRVATFCSGIEAPIQSLLDIGLDFVHTLSVEKNDAVARTLTANFSPELFLHEDMCKLEPADLPDFDVAVAGTPCQPWAAQGNHKGFDDERAQPLIAMVSIIDVKRPAAFILEQSPLIRCDRHKKQWAAFKGALLAIGDGAYHISEEELNPKFLGIPQNRPRLYILGILMKALVAPPQLSGHGAVECKNLDELLDPKPKKWDANSRPHQKMQRKLVDDAIESFDKVGLNWRHECLVLNVGGTVLSVSHNQCPALTANRMGERAYWITNRGRYLNKSEALRLQGMKDLRVPQGVSERQFLRMIGNAMCVPVLSFVFRALDRSAPSIFNSIHR